MDFHDTQEYTGERLYVRRHGVPPTAMSRSMPNQADNSYGFPTQASSMYGEWPFGGVDRKPRLANTDSYNSPGYSLHKRPGTAHPLNEDYGPRQYNQGSSTHASNKRNIDVDSMGAYSHKRYRLSSPNQMQTFGGYPDNSKSKRLHGIEGALKHEYDGEPSYHIKNIEHHRYYEIQQPQAISASQRQAAFLPPQRPRTNINTTQNSYSPTKQEVRRILDYGIPPQPSRNMTSTTHRISRSQEPNSFSLRPEGLQRSRESGYPPAPKTFNCSQPLESGVLIKGSPQRSNSSLTLLDTTVPQLGSPLWKNPSRRDTSIYGPVRERLPGHIDQYQGMSQIRRSVTPKLEHGAGYAAQSRIAPNVQQTSRMILTQISKDSDSKTETTSRRLPRHQNDLSRHSAAPVYTGRNALHITRDPSQQSPQAQSASQKWDDLGEDSEVSDSTPMEHIFERHRYDKSRSQSDSNRNPYKVASVLPRTGIFAKKRPATKPTVPQIDNIREFSGNDAHSPICVDSPPGSPVRTPLIPKSVPMSVRLSPVKVKPNSKARIDPAYDKQRRAAELIIKKEREMLDKEIFGEVIGDIFQENNAETNLAHTESRQKRDRQEAARLIQEEMQKTIDLEIKRDAAERERRRKEEEEEKKRAKREIERKKQREVEEAQKEERRKMAQEKIEASRLKEIAEREKREQERQKEKLVQPDAANRTEMELRKEIAKLRAASLKPATAIPSISKKSQEKGLFFDDEEDSLFVPETNQSRECQDSCSPDGSDNGVDDRDKAETAIPSSMAEIFAKKSNFRSRLQQEREELDADRKAKAEEKRREIRKARLAARDEKSSEEYSMHRSLTRKQDPEDSRRKDCTSNNSNTKSYDIAKEHRNSVPPVPSTSKNRQRARKRRSNQRNERQNEARRKKDGEKARENYRQRLLEDAEEGDYTITDDEINKRLDAFMKKREENYQKKKSKQSSEPDPLVPNADAVPKNADPEHEHESITEPHTSTLTKSPRPAEPQTVDNNQITTDPDQEERDRNALYMREALEALAKSNNRGSRFAKTAAKRTVFALGPATDTSDESDESEEDPTDDPAPGPLAVGRDDQIGGDSEESNQGEGAKEKVNDLAQPEQVGTAPDQSANSEDLPPPTQLEDTPADAPTESDALENTNSTSVPQNLPDEEPPTIETQLVRVYIVKMSRTVDGEDLALHQDLDKLLNLSDANALAEGKMKEYHSNDDISVHEEYVDELFRGQIAQDDKNSIQIWVELEIVPFSEVPNFDPELLKSRFPANSWMIRFKTVKDIFDEDSQTWNTHTTSNILPDHHYSDVGLANHAACDYLIQFMKPRRPVLDHLEQYENELIPLLRRARDENCKEKAQFFCGLENDESQVQWLEEKEVFIEVVCYRMQGPLN